ncbi:protein BTG1 [Peromyscus maniculatus bairdii]|uniref:Protein BTG1 n=1 Tax=Peromyscus maniculatus bairdii TaxID=230844 RepID=A0A6I9MD08_PERMB|nr:protein BTG1 [Peromyscus maniculatus bairdii]XP_036025744.1 protein BTG1 [Onychomys torridus]XP_052609147.1 protein BTG1 [Peromyscus californicus insignis]XP_059101145.1 protein BTG1 [Peromyscus eremicus]
MHPFYTRAATMIGEIAAAVSFISKFLRTKGLTSERQLQTFSQSLQELLAEHYKHHWFPEKPCKGSGYRCIRINHKMDPLIGQAAQRIGLSSQELFRLLPSELTLWVDPYEVSYRIGEDGSICVLYEASPAGGSTPNTSGNVQMVDSRISCKEELLLGRTSPSKNYNMMTVSG